MSTADGDASSVVTDDSELSSGPTTDLVIPVTIGILAAAFSATIIVLIVTCRCRYCSSSASDHGLSENLVVDGEEGDERVEMDDVGAANSQLNAILCDQTCVQNIACVAPDCLAILKIVHELMERLIRGTLHQQLHSPEILTQLMLVARRIGPRVDDVVNALYPPLDPRLLEARCSALILSVNHLVLLTKKTGTVANFLDWTDQSLADIEDHLQLLRLASVAYENSTRHSSSSVNASTDNALLIQSLAS